jgi:hypothetical protein
MEEKKPFILALSERDIAYLDHLLTVIAMRLETMRVAAITRVRRYFRAQ